MGFLFNLGFQNQQGAGGFGQRADEQTGSSQSQGDTFQGPVPVGGDTEVFRSTGRDVPAGGSVLGAINEQFSGGGSTSGGGGGTLGGGSGDIGLAPPQQANQGEIDSLFNESFNFLNQAESNLRGQQPGLVAEANAQALASRGLLGNQRSSSLGLLGEQELGVGQRQRGQQAGQRQTLQELTAANRQRFGGASSAGQAAGEIQGREFQRNMFGIAQNAGNALREIGGKKQDVETSYQQGIQQVEVNKNQAINELNRRLQDKLLEIGQSRAMLSREKNSARLQAAQEYRNNVFQINLQKAQFQQELSLQRQSNLSGLQQNESQLLSFVNQGQQSADQFGQFAPQGISNTSGSTAGGDQQQLTGQISPQRSRGVDELFSSFA